MALPRRTTQEPRRPLPSLRGYARKFSSFLRFQRYRSDEVPVSSFIVALDGSGDFDDIQAAINSLPDTGGKIIIKDGTFNITTKILINKSNVSLLGSGKNTKIQTSSNIIMLDCNNFNDGNGINGIVISDILFSGAGSGNSSNLGIRFLHCSNSTIRNCWVENCGGSGGITVDGSSVVNTTIRDCEVSSCVSAGIKIVTPNTSYLNNYCHDNGEGILVGADNTIVVDNICNSNNFSGIRVSERDFCTLSNNICTGNTNDGILLQASKNNRISNCQCLNNIWSGIALRGVASDFSTGNTITGNICNDNQVPPTQDFGIDETNANNDFNVITSNTCIGNVDGSIRVLGPHTEVGHNITDRPITLL